MRKELKLSDDAGERIPIATIPKPPAGPEAFAPKKVRDAIADGNAVRLVKAENGAEAAMAEQKLSPERLDEFERGLMRHHMIATERDELLKRVASLEVELASEKLKIETLSKMLNAIEDRSRIREMENATRVQVYQSERDEAVAQRAKYETLVNGFLAQLRAFHAPVDPLIKPIGDASISQQAAEIRPAVIVTEESSR